MEVPGRILRRMGYKSDNNGIINRYIRENGAWDEHLQRTRGFIVKAVTGRSVRNLAVYGSGWCLDLPLDELAAIANQVYLYDLVHPPQVLYRIKKYVNISAIKVDVTGGAIMRAYQAVQTYKEDHRKVSPEEICSSHFHPPVIPDYAISVNILSQLGEYITDYLKLHVPYEREEIDRVTELLQQSHLELLIPGNSCLITDVREYSFDMDDGNPEMTEIIKCNLPAATRRETWDWHFDQQGSYRPGRKILLQVMAVEL